MSVLAQSAQIAQAYPQHISELQSRTREAIQRESIEGLIIHSGQGKRLFLDCLLYTSPSPRD